MYLIKSRFTLAKMFCYLPLNVIDIFLEIFVKYLIENRIVFRVCCWDTIADSLDIICGRDKDGVFYIICGGAK